MPYAQGPGVRIHYRVEGQGPPLLLYHAFCGSSLDWYEFGYVERLAPFFRLLLPDARGHGRSDKPTRAEAYAPQEQALDVLAVLDTEGIHTSHYWGYSMGGRVGFALARDAPKRLCSLIIGGIHPYPQNPEGIQRRIATWRQGLEVIEKHMAAGFGAAWSEQQRERFLANDLAAMIAYLQALPGFDYADALSSADAPPCLYYVGTEDVVFAPRAQEFVRDNPQVRWLPLAGLDHYAAYYRADVVVPPVMDFLRDITTPPVAPAHP
ncbi:MAG: alpha/beta fold hydrolase [Chloroflexi bacterium]|nr:alpha/beta fold hydrolase [Chloroflexota bacterium]